jgi:hypothetical protein
VKASVPSGTTLVKLQVAYARPVVARDVAAANPLAVVAVSSRRYTGTFRWFVLLHVFHAAVTAFYALPPAVAIS